ncbi:hypothetical protein ES703_68077 [subsurface metagenome]
MNIDRQEKRDIQMLMHGSSQGKATYRLDKFEVFPPRDSCQVNREIATLFRES